MGDGELQAVFGPIRWCDGRSRRCRAAADHSAAADAAANAVDAAAVANRAAAADVAEVAACARDAPYARVVRVAWAQRRWWAFGGGFRPCIVWNIWNSRSVVYGNVAVKASAVAENRSGGDALVLPACVSMCRRIGVAA